MLPNSGLSVFKLRWDFCVSIVIFFSVVLSVPLEASQERKPHSGAILHLFNYPFDVIERELEFIAELGFKYVQISPPQLSRKGSEWFQRYQPLDYRIIEGPLGSEKQLESLIRKASDLNIGIIADVVLNHMADLGKDYSLDYPPLWVQKQYGVGKLFDYSNFNPPFCINDYNNPYEVKYGRLCREREVTGGLPDLDLTQSKVLKTHLAYLEKLSELGVAGFRLDAAKHMERRYFDKLFGNGKFDDKLIFAEIIADRQTYDRELGEYLNHTNMLLMDFPLLSSLKEAFSISGDLRNLLGGEYTKSSLPPGRSISFVINHDIPNNAVFTNLILNKRDEILAHIFMFARDGSIPHVYSDLGLADNLSSDRWLLYHRKPIIRAGVKFYNATFQLPLDILYSSRCALVIKRGSVGLATINKCSKPEHLRVDSKLSGEYLDLLSDKKMAPQGWLTIPARTGQLFLRTKLL